MPRCDKCGKTHKDVACYEGYGVGIRLCKGVCDGEYLEKISKMTKDNTSSILDLSGNYAFTGDRKSIKAALQSFKEKI